MADYGAPLLESELEKRDESSPLDSRVNNCCICSSDKHRYITIDPLVHFAQAGSRSTCTRSRVYEQNHLYSSLQPKKKNKRREAPLE